MMSAEGAILRSNEFIRFLSERLKASLRGGEPPGETMEYWHDEGAVSFKESLKASLID